MAEELGIVTTQKVALLLMHTAFGAGTTKGLINDRFAVPGRTAATKFMEAARAALARRPEIVEKYKHLYAWYCAQLAEQTLEIKRGSRRPPRLPEEARNDAECAAVGSIPAQLMPVQQDLFG